MLVHCFLLLLTVLPARGMGRGGYGPAPPPYGYPSFQHGPNLYALLDQYNARQGVLAGIDSLLNAGLSDAGAKVNAAAQFRATFEQTILPGIQQGVRDRSNSIAELRAQLLAFATLFDDVRALASDADNLLQQILQFRATRVTDLEGPLSSLANTDIDHNTAIARLAAQGQLLARGVNNAAGRVESNERQISILYSSLTDVVSAVNMERSESFTVELSSATPNVSISYGTAFPAGPHVVYGIIGFKATRNNPPAPAPSYGGYGPQPHQGGGNIHNPAQTSGYGAPPVHGYSAPQQPAIVAEILAANVRVFGDANGFTISLIDDSALWQVDYVRLRVSAQYVSKDIIEFRGH